MPYPHRYFYISLLISIQVIACTVRKPAHAGLLDVKTCDTTNMAIDPEIAREFPSVDHLLRGWISDPRGLFQLPAFSDFFASTKTRLFFSLGEFGTDTAANSRGAKIDAGGVFTDTIFINKTLLYKESKEFLASVVIHENMHAYITWCCLSFAGRWNGVNAAWLKRKFHSDWLRLASQTFPDNEAEHVLMTKHFIIVMVQCLYRYTNRNSTPIQREAVAQSLTWGGLLDTPGWRELMVDTCYFRNVDIWARNLDADSMKGVSWGECAITGVRLLQALELQPISK